MDDFFFYLGIGVCWGAGVIGRCTGKWEWLENESEFDLELLDSPLSLSAPLPAAR